MWRHSTRRTIFGLIVALASLCGHSSVCRAQDQPELARQLVLVLSDEVDKALKGGGTDRETLRAEEQLRKRAAALDAAPHPSGTLRAQIALLALAADELHRRQSVKAYRLDALYSWAAATLNDLLLRHSSDDSEIPSNPYTFLPGPTLKRLAKYDAAIRRVLSAQAVAEHGNERSEPLRSVNSRAQLVKEAQAVETTDLLTLTSLTVPPDQFGEWARRVADKDATVDSLERDRLRAAIALNPLDVAARVRLEELRRGALTMEDVSTRRRGIVMERSLAQRPSGRAKDVQDLLKGRFSDPIAAAETEAMLRLQWQEERDIADSESRRLLLPPPLDASFERWLVSHLTDGELAEVREYLSESRAFLDRAEKEFPDMARDSGAHVDRLAVDAEWEALEQEVRSRATGSRFDRAQLDPSRLSLEAREMLTAHQNETTATFVRRPGSEASLLAALRRYAISAYSPAPEAIRRISTLQIAGFSTSAVRVRRDAAELARLHTAVQSSPEAVAARTDIDVLFKEAAALCQARAARVDGGAKSHFDKDPGQIDRVHTAISEAMTHLARFNSPDEDPDPPDPAGGSVGNKGPPKKPGGPAAQIEDPFKDPELSSQETRFAVCLAKIQQLVKPPPLVPMQKDRPTGKSFVVDDSDPRFGAKRARLGPDRLDSTAWRPNGREVSFDRLENPSNFDELPGGIACGRSAALESSDDSVKHSVLRYDLDDERLKLVFTDGRIIRFPRIDPQRLLACVAFARQTNPVVVSITDAPSPETAVRGAHFVAINDSLRDTQTGRDFVHADSSLWSLRDAYLPNGLPNPVHSSDAEPLNDSLKALATSVAEELLAGLERQGIQLGALSRPEVLLKLAIDKLRSDATLKLPLVVFEEESGPASDRAQALFTRLVAQSAGRVLSRTRAEALILTRLASDPARTETPLAVATAVVGLPMGGIGMLTDEQALIHLEGDSAWVDGTVRLRYAARKLSLGSDVLEASNEVVQAEDAGSQATKSFETVELTFPALRKARSCFGWIQLLRWADSGGVAYVDLSQLAEVKPLSKPTPDYVIRQSPFRALARMRFGIDAGE